MKTTIFLSHTRNDCQGVGALQLDLTAMIGAAISTSEEQKALARAVFKRREDVDPIPALASAIRQVAREHAIGEIHLFDSIRKELR